MTPLATKNTEALILARLIQASVQPGRPEKLSRDAANYLLSIQFPEADVSRMNELSELVQQGALTPSTEAELDSYLLVSNLLAVMQSKARQALRAIEK